MKKLNIVWFVGLMLVCSDVLAKRRRSGGGGAAAALPPEMLGLLGGVLVAILVCGFIIVLAESPVATVLGNLILIGVGVWGFGQSNVEVAWCAYAEVIAPDRLPDLCVASDNTPHGELWRYGMYLLFGLLDTALVGAALWYASGGIRRRIQSVRQRRQWIEAGLKARGPLMTQALLEAHVADGMAMVKALERQWKRPMTDTEVASLVALKLALITRGHAAGRELTPDEVRAIVNAHPIRAA